MILGNVNNECRAYTEELFGPVFTVFKFKQDREAIDMANDTIYGLSGSVYCKDIKRAELIAA